MDELEAQYKSLINDQQSQDSNSSDNSDNDLSPLVMDLAEALKPATRSRSDSETDTCSTSETESVASNISRECTMETDSIFNETNMQDVAYKRSPVKVPQKNNMKQLKNFVNFYKMTKSFEQKLKSLKKKNKNKAHFSMSSLSDAREAINECHNDILTKIRTLRKWRSEENVNHDDVDLEFDLNSIRTKLLGNKMKSLQCLEEPILSPIMQVYAKEDGYCCDLNETPEMEKDPLSTEEQDIKPSLESLLEETQLKEASPKKGGIKLRNITELVDVKSRLGDTGKRLNIPVKVDLRSLRVISATKTVSDFRNPTPTEMPKIGQTKVSSISKPYLCYSDNKSGMDKPVEEDDGFNPIIEATFSLAENKKQDQLSKTGLTIPSKEILSPAARRVSLASQENYAYIVGSDNTISGTITNVQKGNTSKESITNNLGKPIVSVNQTEPIVSVISNRSRSQYSANSIPQKSPPRLKSPLTVVKNSVNTFPQKKILPKSRMSTIGTILSPQHPASTTERLIEKYLSNPGKTVNETTPREIFWKNYVEEIPPPQPNFTGEKNKKTSPPKLVPVSKTSPPKIVPVSTNRFIVDGKPVMLNVLNKTVSAIANERNNVIGGKKFLQIKQNGKVKMFTTSSTVKSLEDSNNLIMTEKQDLTSPTNQKVNFPLKLVSSVENSEFMPAGGKTLQVNIVPKLVQSEETSRFVPVEGKTLQQVNHAPKSSEASRFILVEGKTSQVNSPKLAPVVETSRLNKEPMYKPAILQSNVKQNTPPNSIQSYLVNNKPQSVLKNIPVSSVTTSNKTFNKRETIIGNIKLVKPGNNAVLPLLPTIDLNTENPNVTNLFEKHGLSSKPSQNTVQVQQITKPSTATKVSQNIRKTTEEESTPQDFQSGETSSGLKLISTQNTVPSPSTLAKTKLLFRNDLAKKDNFTKMLFQGTMPRNKLISPNIQNRYFCKWCRTGFCKHYLLWQHIYRITCNMVYECRHCGDRRILFTNRCQLLQHLLVHFGSHKQIVINYNKLKMFKISTQDIMYSAHNGGASVRFYSDEDNEDSEEDLPVEATKQTNLSQSKSNVIRRTYGINAKRIKTNSRSTILDIVTGEKRRPGRPRAIPTSPQTMSATTHGNSTLITSKPVQQTITNQKMAATTLGNSIVITSKPVQTISNQIMSATTLGNSSVVTSEPVQTISPQKMTATTLGNTTVVTSKPVPTISNQTMPATTLAKSTVITSKPVQITSNQTMPATTLGHSTVVTSKPIQTISPQKIPATTLGTSSVVTSKPVKTIITKRKDLENPKSSASQTPVFINIRPDQNQAKEKLFTITISSPKLNQNHITSDQSSSLVTKSTVQSISSTTEKSSLNIKTASYQPASSNTALDTKIRNMLEKEGFTNVILQSSDKNTNIPNRTIYRATKKEDETGLKMSHLLLESQEPVKHDSIDKNSVFENQIAGESNQKKALSDKSSQNVVSDKNLEQNDISDKEDENTVSHQNDRGSDQLKDVSDNDIAQNAVSDKDDDDSNQQKSVSYIDDENSNQQKAVSDKNDGDSNQQKAVSVKGYEDSNQQKASSDNKDDEQKTLSDRDHESKGIKRKSMCTKTEIVLKKLKFGENKIESESSEIQNEISCGSTMIRQSGDKRTLEGCGRDNGESPTKKLKLNTCDSTSKRNETKVNDKDESNNVNSNSLCIVYDDSLSNVSEIVTNLKTSMNVISNIKEKLLHTGIANISTANFVCDNTDSNENNTCNISDEKVKGQNEKNKAIVIEEIAVNACNTNDSSENSDNETDSIDNKNDNVTSEKSEECSNPNINDEKVKNNNSENKDIVTEDIAVNECNTNDSFENSDNETDSIDNNENVTSENSEEHSNPNIHDERLKDSFNENKAIVIEDIAVNECNTNDSFENSDNETDSITDYITSENSEELSNPSQKEIVIENITFAESNENSSEEKITENDQVIENNENDEFNKNIICDENSSKEIITENDQVMKNNENVKDDEHSNESNNISCDENSSEKNTTENDQVMENNENSSKELTTENDTVIENKENITDDEHSNESNNISCDENSSEENITENTLVVENKKHVKDGECSKENNMVFESKEKESLETMISDESMELPNSSVILS